MFCLYVGFLTPSSPPPVPLFKNIPPNPASPCFAMRQPEMSHSPAYYQDGGHLMTAVPHDFTSSAPPPSPPAARLPSRPDPSRSRHSRQSPSEYSAGRENHNRHSHRQGHSHNHHRHHYRHPVYGEAMGSDPEQPASASHREDGSIATRGSNSTGRKERTRGSLSEHSSYMSGERRRTPKRAVQEDVPVPKDNQDALLMLVSFCFITQ